MVASHTHLNTTALTYRSWSHLDLHLATYTLSPTQTATFDETLLSARQIRAPDMDAHDAAVHPDAVQDLYPKRLSK